MSNKEQVVLSDSFYHFACPHCKMIIIVREKEVNCKIFRCGIFKGNGIQIPPHLPKNICDKLKENDLIYGCGKPFMFKGTYVEICDYI